MFMVTWCRESWPWPRESCRSRDRSRPYQDPPLDGTDAALCALNIEALFSSSISDSSRMVRCYTAESLRSKSLPMLSPVCGAMPGPRAGVPNFGF